jgi:hypothetical protein
MIPKKPAPDLIRGGNRFSEKIMLKQKVRLDPIRSNRIKVQRAPQAAREACGFDRIL